MRGWICILTNRLRRVAERIPRRRAGEGSAFCRRYRLKRFVLVERHETILDVIGRENAMKACKRAWNEAIERANPNRTDLCDVVPGRERSQLSLG